MPKERKPGWMYFKSEILNKEFALHEESGWVYFDDGVRYSPEELKILDESGGTIEPALHNVKMVFKGSEVVKYESHTGTNDKGKQIESSGGKSINNPTDTGGKIPDTTGTSAEPKDGELEIY